MDRSPSPQSKPLSVGDVLHGSYIASSINLTRRKKMFGFQLMLICENIQMKSRHTFILLGIHSCLKKKKKAETSNGMKDLGMGVRENGRWEGTGVGR